MAKKAAGKNKQNIELDLGSLNPKQIQVFQTVMNGTSRFICYGGAKGGGKSHLVRIMSIFMMLKYPGIRILVIRATFDDVRQNLIEPTMKLLPNEVYSYNGSTHELKFYNGSSIQYGNWSGLDSEQKYQGQEYDTIFIDEATQFTERMFRHLAGCLRGTKKTAKLPKEFRRKIVLTCNPGGIGHFWVKRLFVEGKYKLDEDDPELNEKPEDYEFIFAKAEDNILNIQENPEYLEDISKMANSAAMRHGDWDILAGNYFSNFDAKLNIHKKFTIPSYWKRYRSFDYGLDMFACFWWAVDTDGRCWCYRGYEKDNLNISEAVKAMEKRTLPTEEIVVTYAPPDMWSRQRESGKSIAEDFNASGLAVTKADNNRVLGHMRVRDMLEPIPLKDKYVISLYDEGKAPPTLPMLVFIDGIGQVLEDIQSIQMDEENPSDCAKKPHDVTHTVDAVRYFCVSRTLITEEPKEEVKVFKDKFFDDDYEDEENGGVIFGEAEESYLTFGCQPARS